MVSSASHLSTGWVDPGSTQSLLWELPDPLIVFDSQDHLIWMNRAAGELWGERPPTWGLSFQAWGEWLQAEGLTGSEGQPLVMLADPPQQGLIAWADGRWFQIKSRRGSKGQLLLSWVSIDPSVHQAMASALQESKVQYQALENSIPDLLVRIRGDGTYLDIVSGDGVKVYDWEHFFVGGNIYNALPPADAEKRMQAVRLAIQTGETQTYEYPLQVGDEWVYEEARVVRSGSDEALFIVRDITDRKRAEQEAQDRQQWQQQWIQQKNNELEQAVSERTVRLSQALKFEALLRTIFDKILASLDEKAILQTVVQELSLALDLAGCEVAFWSATGLHFRLSYPSDHQPFPNGYDCPIEELAPERIRQASAEKLWSYRLVQDEQAQEFGLLDCPLWEEQIRVGVLRLIRPMAQDFSPSEIQLAQQVAAQCLIAIRQSRLYQAAQEQIHELTRLHQLKDDFMSTVSHELRTPLSNLRIALRMMQMAPSEAKREQYYNMAIAQCEREIELVSDLLDLQRLESDSYPLTPTTLDLRSWLPEITAPIKTRCESRGQQFELNLGTDPGSLHTDRQGLERILRELLNNACKYSEAQSRIQLQVQPQARAGVPGIEFQVGNTATIAAEELPRIFDRFYRIPQSDRWQQGGTGLGLSLVREMIGHLQGEVVVTSHAGWTSFTVWIPNLFISSEG